MNLPYIITVCLILWGWLLRYFQLYHLYMCIVLFIWSPVNSIRGWKCSFVFLLVTESVWPQWHLYRGCIFFCLGNCSMFGLYFYLCLENFTFCPNVTFKSKMLSHFFNSITYALHRTNLDDKNAGLGQIIFSGPLVTAAAGDTMCGEPSSVYIVNFCRRHAAMPRPIL